MVFIHFDLMLTTQGWKKDCYVSIDNQGTIVEISNSAQNGTHYIRKGIIIPGFINAHSHAFQYAMVGTAELVSDKPDTFWTWRSKMYELAIKLFPDQLEYIAEMAYAEMLRNGYVHVVEFHYMHNEFGGG
ncbi:MAG: amidohydrolase family protein, partial [Cyclobacteriaceae bacterium]|nr:amidohydrolase family protein [Cyclobacteriaceae bacterium]